MHLEPLMSSQQKSQENINGGPVGVDNVQPLQQNSDSDSDQPPSEFEILQTKVEDLKQFFVNCTAVCYVFSLFIVCTYFNSNTDAFTGGQLASDIGCYANDTLDVPTIMKDPTAVDVAKRFVDTLKFGMVVHFLGIIADTSFAIRVYVKKNQCYRLGSLIIVALYTAIWLGWLIWLHIVILNHEGKVCSGHYLSDSITDNTT